MKKASIKEGFIIELPKETLRNFSIKNGDWLVVRLLNGKELILEKPKEDYWEENFAWGKEFAKVKRIKPKDILKALQEIRSR
ncbi:hypothetical protein HZC34_03535 [Candidatus Saganbacteria bacterium]|nr:hypothetical protein [Candidatus Saganbacteria bacterium]